MPRCQGDFIPLQKKLINWPRCVSPGRVSERACVSRSFISLWNLDETPGDGETHIPGRSDTDGRRTELFTKAADGSSLLFSWRLRILVP